MAQRLPYTVRFDASYARAVVERTERTAWMHLFRGLAQLPRLALLIGLGLLTVVMGTTLYRDLSASYFGVGKDFDRTTLGVAVWTWGAIVLMVELCVLAVRDAADTPWPGSAPSTGGLFLRATAGSALLGVFEASGLGIVTVLFIVVPCAYLIYAWSLPAALRGLVSSQIALRSLRTVGEPISPGRLATERGKLGRRLVTGRIDTGEGVLSVAGDGGVARLDARDLPSLIQLDAPPQPMVLIAEAHVDDGGYRSGGVRLETGALPIWLLAAAGAPARIAGFRGRLRLAAFLDGIYVATVTLGAVFFAAYIALAKIARI